MSLEIPREDELDFLRIRGTGLSVEIVNCVFEGGGSSEPGLSVVSGGQIVYTLTDLKKVIKILEKYRT